MPQAETIKVGSLGSAQLYFSFRRHRQMKDPRTISLSEPMALSM